MGTDNLNPVHDLCLPAIKYWQQTQFSLKLIISVKTTAKNFNSYPNRVHLWLVAWLNIPNRFVLQLCGDQWYYP